MSAAGVAGPTTLMRQETTGGREITFLASMDFDLPRGASARLGAGEFFGEIGAMSGWPQSVTARSVSDCELGQIRVPALRLMKRRSQALKERLDEIYKGRALFTQLKSTPLGLQRLLHQRPDGGRGADLLRARRGGGARRRAGGRRLLVRSGFVQLVQRFGEGDLTVS